LRVFEESNQAIVITDLEGTIVAVNPKHEELTGYPRQEVLGKNPKMMKSGIHDDAFYREMWQSITLKGRWIGEIWDRKKSGELFMKQLTISTILAEDGAPMCYLAMFLDVTKTQQDQSKLEYLAHYDAVTKLPNRILFIDRLGQAMARANRNGVQAALMFIDLDGFKNVNDRYGHRAGDRLLYLVAQRLAGSVREIDTVARFGGDEFVVVVPDVNMVQGALVVAKKLKACLQKPFEVGRLSIPMTASIGVAIYPFDGNDTETLLRSADFAMYAAKRAGKNSYMTYESEMAST